jgi:soluble lytic murein transglycosylase-like protein
VKRTLGLLLAAFLASAPAAADEAVARRLAALRSLVGPHTPRLPNATSEARACPSSPAWATSSDVERQRLEDAVRDAALRFGLDPRLIWSVIRHESNYDPHAVSHKGAMGLMQLMPATARELGVVCAFDPRQNVLAGTRYLRQLYDQLGTWSRALAGYHAGPSRVRSGRIPDETLLYVGRVLGSWRRAQSPTPERR